MKKSTSKLLARRGLPVLLSSTMVLGGTLPAMAADGKFYSTYSSLEAVRDASEETNLQIAEESVVLMKNENSILPLKDVKSVSVFGKAAEDPFYAGGGSGTAAGYYPDEMYCSVYQSLEAAGYSVNPALRSFYEKEASKEALEGADFSYSVGEDNKVASEGNRASISDVDPADFSGSVLSSYERYSDAAIVVIGRTGSEGGDKDMGRSREAFLAEELSILAAAGASQEDLDARRSALEEALDNDPEFAADALRHGLTLTYEEEQMIRHVTENFDKVILVLNSPQQIELGWVKDGTLGEIDACLWVGQPGLNGFEAIGKVLDGEINPSGRLVDIWQSDMTKDPTYPNVMENLQTENATTDYGNEALFGDGTQTYSGWYAPGVNIHRSAFGGRNPEYFSEDGLLSGLMAANEVKGATEKGCYTMVKHFALNEQETNRNSNGILTWADEQAIREIYLVPFKYAVQDGGSKGIIFVRMGCHLWMEIN